jgi:hypothetical protein
MPARLTAALACLVVASLAAAAAAEEADRVPLILTVEGGADCPGRDAFLVQLQSRSARIQEARAGERSPSMRVELRASGGQFLGRLTYWPVDGPLNGQESLRELRGTDWHIVPLRERHLRRTIGEFVAHYHSERNHQGLGNLICFPARPNPDAAGDIRRRQRLGGLLSFYERTAV